MSLFHLVYVSSAVSPFTDADLLKLLEQSRQKNNELNVTGMLLYRGGNFMQVLEGREPTVRSVHAHISRDPRHFGLLTLLEGSIETRTFSRWTMGFRHLDSSGVKDTPGYNEFLNDDWLSPAMGENPARAMQLLEVFRRSMR